MIETTHSGPPVALDRLVGRRGRPRIPSAVTVRDDDTPPAMRDLARRRMRGFARHFGAQPDLMTLEDLCASCYLQGMRDAIDAQDSTANKSSTGPEARR
jgi:hypothetical protein